MAGSNIAKKGKEGISKSFIVQGSILAIAGIVSKIIGLVYRIPMTNALGEKGLSYYESAFSIYSIALIISSYGLPLAVSKMVAGKLAKKEYKNSIRLFKASMGFATLSGGIMALIIFFWSDYLAVTLFKNINCALPLKVLAPTIFMCAVMGVFRGFFQGNGSMIPTAVSQLVEQIINAAVSIWATFTFINLSTTKKFSSINTSKGAWGAAGGTLGTCIGAFAGLCILILIFLANVSIIKKKSKKDNTGTLDSYRSIYKSMILTILPVILGQTLYNLNSIVDRTMFSHLVVGSADYRDTLLGRYGKYFLLISVPIAIATALGNSILPAIVKEHVNENRIGLESKINLAIKFNMIIAIPSAVGLAVLGSNIVELLYPGTNPMVAGFLRYGSIAVVFYALSTISNAILQGINLMRYPLIHSAISFIIHLIVVVIALFAGLGINAVVIGNGVFGFCVCILNWYKIGKELNYKQEIIKTFVIPTISSAFMGVFAWITATLLIKVTSNLITTIIAVCIAVVSYMVLLIRFGGISEVELKRMPKGNTLCRICIKLHIL